MALRHVHLFDFQLVGGGGHYLAHDLQLLRDLRRRGISTTTYGRKESTLDTIEGTSLHRVFTHDIFREVATDSIVWPIENYERINAELRVDLSSLVSDSFSSDDLIYVPNVLQNQLGALTDWICQLPEQRRPRLAVMLRYLNHAMDYVAKRQNKELIALYYRHALRDLIARHPRTLICADTQELAKAYQVISGVPVLELPNPMDVSGNITDSPTPSSPSKRPIVVYQGHTSPLRGFHFLPEMIQRCAALKPRPVFVIQIQNRDKADSMGLKPVVDYLDKIAGPDVELLNGPLSEADYLALMNRADVVLLPYTPSFYGHGSSGVFTEAASLGKVVVVCQGTVPARQGREYGLGTVVADQWTPASLSQALAQALPKLDVLQHQAKEAAPRFRREQSAAALWDKVIAALPQ